MAQLAASTGWGVVVAGSLVAGAVLAAVAGGRRGRYAVTLLTAIDMALALATVLGGTLLVNADPRIIGTAQAVSAGAVLAVVSIAIIPHSFSEVSRRVASATVLGFIGGYLLS